MRFRTYGGLCNRLRTILSYRATFGNIDVVWHPDGEIANARWSDVFEPLSGVTFHEGDDYGTMTLDAYPHAAAGWQYGYRDLTLRSDHLDRFASLKPSEPYSAMHLRRTDHVHLATITNLFRPDEDYVEWVKGATSPIYLATDNGTSQFKFLDVIRDAGKRAITAVRIEPHPQENQGGRRATTLADAAIDLFICAGAREFKGSGASSFSATVDMLRTMGGWWS